MAKSVSKFIALATALGLTACGGGGAMDTARTQQATGPNPLSLTSDGQLMMSGEVITANGDPLVETKGQAQITQNGVFFTAGAGNADVFAFNATSSTADLKNGAIFGVNGGANLPTNRATATYSGDYIGTISQAGRQGAVGSTITGDITINADFIDNKLNGTIGNRVVKTVGGAPNGIAQAVVIQTADINSSATYSADTSLGGIIQSSNLYLTSPGTVRGIIGGENGSSTAGVFEMEHRLVNNGNAFTERGAFVAESN